MNYKCGDNCENAIVLVITELSNVVKPNVVAVK